MVVKQLDQTLGLSETSNAFFEEDNRNNLWISSIDGLNRFDGISTTVYRPSLNANGYKFSSIVSSRVFIDNDKNYWYSTNDGIHKINCDLKTSASWPLLVGGDSTKKLQEVQIVHLQKDHNLVWLKASTGLYTIDLTKIGSSLKFVHAFPEETQRFVTITAKNGALQKIIATSLGGNTFFIVQFTGKGHVGKILPIKIKENHYVFNIIVEGDTIAWVTCSDGLYKYDLQKHQVTNLTPFAPDFAKEPNLMFIDLIPYGKRYLWIISYNKGLFLFDKYNLKSPFVQHFSSVIMNGEKIKLDYLDKIFALKDGTICLANWNSGLMYFNPTLVKSNSIMPEYGITKDVKTATTSMCVVNKNKIYFTVPEIGLFEGKFENGEWITELISGQLVRCKKIILKNSNELFLADDGSVFHYVIDSKKLEKLLYLPKNQGGIKDICLMDQHALVVQSSDRLLKLDLDKNLPVNEKMLGVGQVNTIHKLNNSTIAINYFTDSLLIVKMQKGEFLPFIKTVGIGRVNHIITSKIPHTYWIASSLGLLKLEVSPNLKIEYFWKKHIKLRQAFNGVVEDRHGNLWLSSNSGISQVIFTGKTILVNKFNDLDGMLGGQFTPGCAINFNNELFLFGSRNGIQSIESDKIALQHQIPNINLKAVTVDGEPIDADLCNLGNFQFKCFQRNIGFYFTTSDFVGLNENEFQYRLYKTHFPNEQYKWINIGNSGNINLASLNKGDYTLEVIVCNSDGIWMKKQSATKIKFQIQPYWYETTWFYTLLLVAFIVLTYLIYRNRLRRIQQKATLTETELKVLRLQMNPHFIYNCLSAIQSYVVKQNVDKANGLIVSFSKLMRKVLTESVKPYLSLGEEKELLESYLRTESLRFENKLNFQVEIDPALDADEVFIPTMILQPFVENAIVHGFAKGVNTSQITISFKPKGNMLECTVQDNGAGLGNSPGNEKHQSQAIEITQKRLQLISKSASMQLINLVDQSPSEHGVMVILLLPLDLKPD